MARWDFLKKPEWFIPIIIAVVLAFIGGRAIYININSDTISNFTGSYCKDCVGVTQVYSETDDIPDFNVFNRVLTITNSGDFLNKGDKLNVGNVLLVLSNNQKLFIKDFKLGVNTVGYCNPDLSLCFINPNYRLTDEQIEKYKFIDYTHKEVCRNREYDCYLEIGQIEQTEICMLIFMKEFDNDSDFVINFKVKGGCYY